MIKFSSEIQNGLMACMMCMCCGFGIEQKEIDL